jgi:hypothetical protein
MKSFKFWIPTIIGGLITPLLLGAALISTGAGHGSYLSILVFYPIPLLLSFLQPVKIDDAFFKAIVENTIIALACGTAIIQFPLYGFIISYAKKKRGSRFWAICKVVAWLHIIVSLIVLPYTLIARK